MNIVKGTVYISALSLDKINYMVKKIVNHQKHIHEIEAKQELIHKDFAEKCKQFSENQNKPKKIVRRRIGFY